MVIARDQITLSWQLDVQGTVYYYKKQSSTATAPEKPTSYPPTGWTTTEPGYSSGETSTLYVTVCTLYDNGSFEYSDVSVSASFEAAKEAYNKAVAAQTAANNAITAANGKTKIFYQDDAPTAGMAVGDMWFDTDGGNAVYQYTSTGWVLRQFGNGSIAAGSITANEIYGQYLSAIFANMGEITAGKMHSSDYQAPTGSSVYSTAGMIIDLDNKAIRTPKTAILSDGSIYSSSVDLEGKITATSGTVGGWEIGSGLYTGQKTAYGDDNDGLYLGSNGIDVETSNGYVRIAPRQGIRLKRKNEHELFFIRLEGTDGGAYTQTTVELSYITIRGKTYNNNAYSSGNPQLRFENTDATKGCALTFTDSATVQSPASLTLAGNQGNEYFIAPNIKATGAFYGTLTGHASLDLPLTGGTLSGSVAISATGRGYNLTDASGTTYGGIYENGDNLWIGAASSTSPHHRGASGNTYISSGYSTSRAAGNSTIYISVPSLSGTTWSHTAYGVLHTGNYNSYALPLSGGTLSGNLTFSATTDNGIIQGYNSTTKYNILRNHGNGNVSLSACSAGLYLGYTNTTFVNFMNGLMILNSSGDLTITGKVISGATDTSERLFRAINANGSIELNASAGNKGIYDRSGSRWIMYLDTNSTGDTPVRIPRALHIGTADLNGCIELYHATPYIDFHFGRSTADYTYRIMESSSGVLWFSGSQSVAGNITISTTSTTVERVLTISTGNVSGAVRANNGGNGGAFGLYVTKTGGTARTGTWLSAMDSGGTYHANWTSDEREKNVFGLMDSREAETLLRSVDIINFSYKSDQNQIVQNGMIAQQMRDVLTENGIGYRSYLNIISVKDDDFLYDLNAPESEVRYGIDYARLTPILWKGWQLHDDRITALEKENEALKAEIKALKGAA